ncbi:MAG: PilT/PilU family type 4a pilus ATPase [Polyangiaceae bacterium]
MKKHGAEHVRVAPGERVLAKVDGSETDVAAALTASDVRRAASEVVSTDDLDQMSSRPRIVRHELGDELYIVEITSHRLGVQLIVRPAQPASPAREREPEVKPARRTSRGLRAPDSDTGKDASARRSRSKAPPRRSVPPREEPIPPPPRVVVEERPAPTSTRHPSPLAVGSAHLVSPREPERPAPREPEPERPAPREPERPAPREPERLAPREPERPAPREPERPAPRARTGPPRIEALLREMGERDASDLHLSTGAPPVMRIHGEMTFLTEKPELSSEDITSLLEEIMPRHIASTLHERHDADFAVEVPGLARFRVNAFMDRRGAGAVVRKIPIEVLTAEQLALPKAVVDLCWLTKGLVLVTGPTGSGKSTTLAALIDFINRNRDDHVITIEDPIEFVHPNRRCLVNQREVGTHTDSFKSALRAALREDPDVVLVGELRDLDTIAIAIETAETGHLVFGTLHTSTAMSTVDRLVDQFPPDRQSQIRVMLAGSLKGVVSQVLCKKNGGGRVAALEVLLGTSAVTSLVRDGKTHQLSSVMQTGKSHGMRTLNDALFELVQRGLVTSKEAYTKAVDKSGLLGAFQAAGIPSPV